MPDYYLLDRAGITWDYITARRAGELLTEAQESKLEIGLCGDLETGFYFWSFDVESGLRLIHYHVTPVPVDDVLGDVYGDERHVANT